MSSLLPINFILFFSQDGSAPTFGDIAEDYFLGLQEKVRLMEGGKTINRINDIDIIANSVHRLIHNTGTDSWMDGDGIYSALTLAASKSQNSIFILSPWLLRYLNKDLDSRAKQKLTMRLKNLQPGTVILTPVNVDNAHWVLFEISLSKGTAVIYDSLWNLPEPKNYIKKSKTMCKTLVSYFAQQNLFKGPFQITHNFAIPTQKNFRDCGVYVILYAESVILGKPLHNLKHSHIPAHRQRIARALLDASPLTIKDASYRSPPSPSTSHEDCVEPHSPAYKNSINHPPFESLTDRVNMLTLSDVAPNLKRPGPLFYQPNYDTLHIFRKGGEPFVDVSQDNRLFTQNATNWWDCRMVSEWLSKADNNPDRAWKKISAYVENNPAKILSVFVDSSLPSSSPRKFFFSRKEYALKIRKMFETFHPTLTLPEQPMKKPNWPRGGAKKAKLALKKNSKLAALKSPNK